ncbi:MAG: hypothetical protein IT436_05665 [Phycisphaerales bacterium]|nr:hypothetical protein [Phycisphaerales bacterium]
MLTIAAAGLMTAVLAQPLPAHRMKHEERPWVGFRGPVAPATPGERSRPAQPWSPRDNRAAVQVNVDAMGMNIIGDAANEPSIAVDPTNPARMAIGWRQFDTIDSAFRQAGYGYSATGGRSWTFPGRLDAGIFRSDPVLDSLADGAFLYYSLTNITGLFTCDVFRSTDGGAVWTGPIPAAGGDKNWMVTDRRADAPRGHAYGTWNSFYSCCGETGFVRSINGGVSFQGPIELPEDPYWGTLAVDASGDLYILGISDAGTEPFYEYIVLKSADAKIPTATPTFSVIARFDPRVLGEITGFTDDTPNPGGLLGQGWIDADTSTGPTRGNLYVCWSLDLDGFEGPDPLEVVFTRSTDGGATWSPPRRLNDDAADAWQWFGTMSVAPSGRIDVVWNDTRNSGGRANISELFYTSSADGGATWSANERLGPAWDSWIGWPQQNKIGDYYHMVSDVYGADLALAATFNGEQDVYHLRIGREVCRADFDMDGIVDFTDYLAFLNLYDGADLRADLNGDGLVDFADYLEFLNLYDGGCA